METDPFKAAGSRGTITPLLHSKLSFYRSRCAYESYYKDRGDSSPERRSLIRDDRRLRPPYSPLLVANRLVSPSYVSYSTALHWHGLIPAGSDRVICSATSVGRSCERHYGIELYSYTLLPKAYFAIGCVQLPVGSELCTIATPEKALCDLILGTRRLFLPTRSAVCSYLLETLHIDEQNFRYLSPELIERCASVINKKQKDLLMLATFLNELGYHLD